MLQYVTSLALAQGDSLTTASTLPPVRFNCIVILLLLMAFGQTQANGEPLDATSLKYVWRIQYGVATLILLVLTIYR